MFARSNDNTHLRKLFLNVDGKLTELPRYLLITSQLLLNMCFYLFIRCIVDADPMTRIDVLVLPPVLFNFFIVPLAQINLFGAVNLDPLWWLS